ncbi:MAG: stage III sporulation protein AG [Lachnospiraceae bacterium]|nr:stage III sporulation protein AG [Lachnospiraceae bacterium]
MKSLFKSKSENPNKGKLLKKDQLIIFLLFGILLLVIAIPVEPKKKSKEANVTENQEIDSQEQEGMEKEGAVSTSSYEEQQEARLEEILRKVEGVGEVEVMITLQASSEKVVEKDQPSTSQDVEEQDSGGGTRSTQDRSWSESTVYWEQENGSRTPYVIKELKPRVEGVIVIAQGGGDPEIKQNIMEAVQALFPVEAHKIKIMKMEGSK